MFKHYVACLSTFQTDLTYTYFKEQERRKRNPIREKTNWVAMDYS